MLISNLTLTEGYFVSTFINSLNEEICPIVKMFQPKTVQQATECAELQELAVEEQSNRGWNKEGGIGGPSGKALALPAPSPSIGNSLREQRRLAGLCFRCGDKYTPGHQCKRQLLLLEGIKDGEDEVEEAETQEREEKDEKMEISLHALRRVSTSKIIKVDDKAQEEDLSIPIDNGSTHSFLDERVAKRLHCRLTGTHPLSVTVANGQKVICRSTCMEFCQQIQGEDF